MADNSVEIPNRAAFKASEVCEIARIPPYVLRSWEKEFPGLGAAARPGGPRIYRRTDVEQILRIKQLVFAEGLTLAGARRKIEGDQPAEDDALLEVPPPASEDTRARVTKARRDLRSLLDLLSQPAAAPRPAEPAATPHPEPASDEQLPLLDDVMDAPAAAQKPRRAAKQRRDAAASNVE